MRLNLNRKIAIGAGLVLALGGAAGAVAATQGSGGASPRQAYIDSVAKHLGVAPGSLSAAVRAADLERIEAALASGRISHARAQKLKARLEEPGAVPFFGAGLGAGSGRRRAGILEVAAQYLDVSTATLRAQRAAGHSLGEIAATTTGKSAAGLRDALLNVLESRLSATASAHRLSPRGQQRGRAALARRVDRLLERTAPSGRPARAARAR